MHKLFKPLLCLALGGMPTIATAQDVTLNPNITLTNPNTSIDLNSLILDRGRLTNLDIGRITDFLNKTRKDGFLTGRVFFSPRLKSGENLLSKLDGFNGAVPLPEIEITLRDDEEDIVLDPIKTNLSGSFVTMKVPAGQYVMCADAPNFEQHCTKLQISGGRVHMDPFALRPKSSRDTGTVTGRIQLADGGFPHADIPYANILKAAKITAFDGNGGKLGETFANVLGDYVLPGLPAGRRARLVVTFENQSTARNLRPSAVPSGGFLRQDITFNNSRPVVTDPVATLNGVDVLSAPPNETVKVSMDVSDPDGDAVSVRWFLDDGAGQISSDTGPAIEWKLPNAMRPNQLKAVISDGKGGVRTRVLRVKTSKGETFTGRVTATDIPAVANVEVEVNGTVTRTNSAGQFSLQVKAADRYVLNVRSPGHALLSQVYGLPSTGGEYELVRATVQRFDPTREIVLTDKRRQKDCRGAPSASLNWESAHRLRRTPIRLGNTKKDDRRDKEKQMFEFVDLPADLSPQRKRPRDCGPGVTIRIPANGLVDADGNPPAGDVNVAVSTYDIEAQMEMPGDYTVAKAGQIEALSSMESYGAAFVEVRDATREYNLRDGVTAELTIPVAQGQIASGGPLGANIPIFHYDEDLGVWNKTGDAQLNGAEFVTKVAHFSAINADVEKVEPACVHVKTNGTGGVMPDQFMLEFTIPADPGSGAAAKVRSGMIDAASSDDHVLYNLPEDRDIVLVPYDPATNTPFGTFVVNSGAPHGSSANPPSHTLCTETAELFIPDVPRQLPADVEYLQGLYSFFAYDVTDDATNPNANPTYAQDLIDASSDYYATVDPLANRRDTFGQFKDLWGFDGTETNARYANSADLGFGRDMHCTSSDINADGTDDIACYVSNYGFREDPDQDNANWAGSQDESQYVATVAMEWAPLENAGTEANPTFNAGLGNIVKFFVYGRDPDDTVDTDGNGDPGDDHDEATFVLNADLDGYGSRPVPQLCMVCHGGTTITQAALDSDGNPLPNVLPVFNAPADVAMGSRFLPFDLESYTFPNAGPVVGTQEPAFKTLNQEFVLPTNPSAAIEEVIEEFYAPNGTSATQNRDFVVSGWTGTPAEEAMYEHVVGPNCRICHVAHDVIGREFQTAGSLGAGFAGYVACSERSMPHSVRTYERFWTSLNPHQPGQLVNWMSDQGANADACTFPPNNGQTFEAP